MRLAARIKQIFEALSLRQRLFGGIGIYGKDDMPRPGTEELLAMYRKSPWIRAVVNKVSKDVAKVSWSLYVARPGPGERAVRLRKAQHGTYEERLKARKQAEATMILEEITEHPMLDLLDKPNPFLTGAMARQVTQVWLDLKGEGYWLKERGTLGEVIALWPIPPQWVRRTPTPGNPFYELRKGTFQQIVPMSEVMTFADVNAENPYGRGTGTAEALADEIETDEYAAKHTKAWFYNRARPDILVAGPSLSESEARRLEEDWNQKHQGFWRAFKARFTNAELQVHEISQTFESMQLVDLRRYERDTIVQVFGVPPEILGILAQSNRATISAADFLYESHVIVPRLELVRDVLQEQLVSDFDERLIVDYENPVDEDHEFQLEVAKSQSHTLKVNEWRAMAGLEPLTVEEGGEMFLVPFNLVAVPSLAGETFGSLSVPTSVSPSVPAPENQGAQQSEERSTPGTVRKQLSEEEVVRMVDRAVDPAVLVAGTAAVLESIIAERGEDALRFLGLGISFDVQNPRVQTFLAQYGANRIQDLVNETTKEQLKTQLIQGVQQGESIAQLSARVSEVFSEAKGPRAETISRTEVIRATNWGQAEAWRQSGVIEQKEWISTPDERTRGQDPGDLFNHVEPDGQIRALDEPFLVSGQLMMFPGDDSLGASAGNLINCRCTVAAVVHEERSLLGSEEARDTYWKQFDLTAQRDERKFRAALVRALQEQQNALNGLLRGAE